MGKWFLDRRGAVLGSASARCTRRLTASLIEIDSARAIDRATA